MTTYEQYDLLVSVAETLIVLLGFAIAYLQLRQLKRDSRKSVEIASRRNAMDLVARYSDRAFMEYRIKLRTDSAAQKDRLQCGYMLNFLEEVAMAVKHETANAILLKEFFATILRGWMGETYMKDTIEKFRERDEATFENLGWLYGEWEIKPPRIPPLKSPNELG
jgi:hypothetical protein